MEILEMKAMKNTSSDMTGWGSPISLASIKRILTPDLMYFQDIRSLTLINKSSNVSREFSHDLSYIGDYELSKTLKEHQVK